MKTNAKSQTLLRDPDNVAIKIDGVSMSFNMASEQLNSLKEYFIKLARRELFFKEFKALKNISLEVQYGDVFGIVGTNGSGKSTLLKIIAGVLEPSQGSCVVKGRIAPLIELGAGFDYELTARENIFLNSALLGYSKQYVKEHFNDIVDFAELHDFLDLPMKNYSSGMVARVAFSVATAIVPDILIVDETLSVGDMFFREKCENRIKQLIEEYHTTVLFVSHSIDDVERICQKAVWIEKGDMRMIGDAADVCAAYRNMMETKE
ncbi:MAG: ABC transporter ATP-binding protein [Coriobacteriia bacterium]|nr:ABC transporter ATP-binding protein [Coriobacteriia bacterium]